jgi:Domain of unknown function (DUF4278)
MKLIYRGVAYDYTPPEVAVQSTGMRGNYRGVKHQFNAATDASNLHQDSDLIYRGVAYHVGNNAATVAQAAAASRPDVDDLARSLMMANHSSVKNREQSQLLRTGLDVGLDVAASRYWSHIQGKINPGAHSVYDRSHVAFS